MSSSPAMSSTDPGTFANWRYNLDDATSKSDVAPSFHHPTPSSVSITSPVNSSVPSSSATPVIPSSSLPPQYRHPLENFGYGYQPPTFPFPGTLSPHIVGGYILHSPTLQQGFMGMSLQTPQSVTQPLVGNPVKPEDLGGINRGLPGLIAKEQLQQHLKEKQSVKEKEKKKKSSKESKGKGKAKETESPLSNSKEERSFKEPTGDLRNDLEKLEAELDSFGGSVGTFKEESLDSFGLKDVSKRKENFATPHQIRRDLDGFEGGGDDFLKEDDPLAAKVWRLFVKARKTLPNGERMENLTWRMMSMNLMRQSMIDEKTGERVKDEKVDGKLATLPAVKGRKISFEESTELRRVSFDEGEETRGRKVRGSASASHSPADDPDAMDWRTKSQSRSRSRMDWVADTISMDWRAQSKSRSRSRATIGNRMSMPHLNSSLLDPKSLIEETNEEPDPDKRQSPSEGPLSVQEAEANIPENIEDTLNQLINQSLTNSANTIFTANPSDPEGRNLPSAKTHEGQTNLFKDLESLDSISPGNTNLQFMDETSKMERGIDRAGSSTLDNGLLDPHGLGFSGYKTASIPFPHIPPSLHYPQPETSLGLERGLKNSPLLIGGLSQSLPNPGFRHPLSNSTPVSNIDSMSNFLVSVGQSPQLGGQSTLSLGRPPNLNLTFPHLDHSTPLTEEMKNAFGAHSFGIEGQHPGLESLYSPWPPTGLPNHFLTTDLFDHFTASALGVSPVTGETPLVGSFDSTGPTLVNLSQVQTHRHIVSESEGSFTFSPNSLLSGDSSKNNSPSPPATKVATITKRVSMPSKSSLTMSSISESKGTDVSSTSEARSNSLSDLASLANEPNGKKRSNSIGEGSLAGKVAATKITDRSSSDTPMVCGNCKTSNTPLWRRDAEGRPLCNACGLFRNLHGIDRPSSLNTGIVKKRNRAKGTKDTSKKDSLKRAPVRNRKQSTEESISAGTSSRTAARQAASPYPSLILNHHLRSQEPASSESSNDSAQTKINNT